MHSGVKRKKGGGGGFMCEYCGPSGWVYNATMAARTTTAWPRNSEWKYITDSPQSTLFLPRLVYNDCKKLFSHNNWWNQLWMTLGNLTNTQTQMTPQDTLRNLKKRPVFFFFFNNIFSCKRYCRSRSNAYDVDIMPSEWEKTFDI